jgi:hypothetical protein
MARDLRLSGQVVAAFALSRAALLTVGLVASNGNVFGMLRAWDAGWYLEIARDGYAYVPGEQSSIAFAPALPMLMRASAGLIGRADDLTLLLAGVVVSNIALLCALAFLGALTRLDFDPETAERAQIAMLVFPSTVFFSVVYPHALSPPPQSARCTTPARRAGRWPASSAHSPRSRACKAS